MLAIHNLMLLPFCSLNAANAFAKLSKCQQFTTTSLKAVRCIMLQTLLQSYQNVSNSQPNLYVKLYPLGCKRFCKVIKMLAIHNAHHRCPFYLQLQTLLQSYQNVSNSQQLPKVQSYDFSCKRFCKVIKMLAIHNNTLESCQKCKLQTLLQSYQNVSNSQRFARFRPTYGAANAFAKLSKCQQFTT